MKVTELHLTIGLSVTSWQTGLEENEKMTCMTSSASCVQQSVVHLGELNRYLHPVVPSITHYLPFGLVFCKTRGKTKNNRTERLKQEHTISPGRLHLYSSIKASFSY